MVKVGDRGSDMKTEQLLELVREGFDIAEYDEFDRCIVLQSRRTGVFRFERFAQRVVEAAQAENIARVEAMLSKEDDKNPMAASFNSVIYAVLAILKGDPNG